MNRMLYLCALLPSAFLAAACSPNDSQTAGQRGDQAVAHAKNGAQEAAQTTKDMAGGASTTAADAIITARVNAALSGDTKLKTGKIDVYTSHGVVVLKGSVPDAESRQRATMLVSAVDGVVDVDNRLEVTG